MAGLGRPLTLPLRNLPHLFSSPPLGRGTVQELLGHRDVSTTMSYTHVLNREGREVRSPGMPPPAGHDSTPGAWRLCACRG